jgi:hypothetical protein
LQRVVHRVLIPEQAVRETSQCAIVAADERVEGVHVATAGPAHELALFGCDVRFVLDR